jgi:hypothetical protein
MLKQLRAWSTGLVGREEEREGVGDATRLDGADGTAWLDGADRATRLVGAGRGEEAEEVEEKTRAIGVAAGVRLGRIMVRVMIRSSRSWISTGVWDGGTTTKSTSVGEGACVLVDASDVEAEEHEVDVVESEYCPERGTTTTSWSDQMPPTVSRTGKAEG